MRMNARGGDGVGDGGGSIIVLMNTHTRRAFLKKAAAGAALAGFPLVLPARAVGRDGHVPPSGRIALGVVGIGPRCTHVLGCMLEEPDVQCVAVSDVQASRRAAGKAMVDNRYGNTACAAYADFREMLARPDIDAVLVATGDRWHALASIMAARAGKDVYSEKPCGITIADCQQLADTMRRFGRVFQAGTQRRSIGNFELAVQLARSGKLERLHTLVASVYWPRIEHRWLPAEQEPPKDVLDWDMWLGPAPWRPYNRHYVAGGWRGQWDFDSGATLLDWGAHTVDLCQWANGADDTMPVEYEPTPTAIVARYANGVRLVIEYLKDPFGNRSPQWPNHLGTCPVRFVGDEGWVQTGDSGAMEVHPPSLKGELAALRNMRRMAGTTAASHGRNFFDCVKSRCATAANPLVMRHSHIACHAAAIAWILGRKVRLDVRTETFIDDEEANRLRSRAARQPWCI